MFAPLFAILLFCTLSFFQQLQQRRMMQGQSQLACANATAEKIPMSHQNSLNDDLADSTQVCVLKFWRKFVDERHSFTVCFAVWQCVG